MSLSETAPLEGKQPYTFKAIFRLPGGRGDEAGDIVGEGRSKQKKNAENNAIRRAVEKVSWRLA